MHQCPRCQSDQIIKNGSATDKPKKLCKALDRESGQLLDWECGRRDKKTLKKMVDRLTQWGVKLYCTDK